MKNILDNVKPEHQFILKDGRAIRNLGELHNELKNMDDDVFNHHVNEEKNDFANWIRGIHKDNRLANKLLKLKTKEHILKHISNRISRTRRIKKGINNRTDKTKKTKAKKKGYRQRKKINRRTTKKTIRFYKCKTNNSELLKLIREDFKAFFTKNTMLAILNSFKKVYSNEKK